MYINVSQCTDLQLNAVQSLRWPKNRSFGRIFNSFHIVIGFYHDRNLSEYTLYRNDNDKNALVFIILILFIIIIINMISMHVTNPCALYPPYFMPFRNILHRYVGLTWSENLFKFFLYFSLLCCLRIYTFCFMCTWHNCAALRFACSVSSFVCAFDFLFSCTFLSFCHPPNVEHLSFSRNRRTIDDQMKTHNISNSKRKKSHYTCNFTAYFRHFHIHSSITKCICESKSDTRDARCPYFIPFVSFIRENVFISSPSQTFSFYLIRFEHWIQYNVWLGWLKMQCSPFFNLFSAPTCKRFLANFVFVFFFSSLWCARIKLLQWIHRG